MTIKKKSFKLISALTSVVVLLAICIPSNVVSATQITDVLRLAFSFMGTPYVWGGSRPGGFDCSGLTSYVYKHALDSDIGRTTYDQIYSGKDVTNQKFQPGDLILPSTEHVQLYIGNNTVLHAPHTGDVVRIANFYKAYSARRIVADSPMEEEVFDYKYYSDKYGDLKKAYGDDYGNLYVHYITCGIGEGRRPSKIFDPVYYLNANPDLKKAYGSNYQAAYDHFVTYGYNEDRPTASDCNIAQYKKDHPDFKNMSNLDLYSIMKEKDSIQRIMFDYKYYADTYPDLKAAYGYDYMLLYNHYKTFGISEGRKPSRIFDPTYYLAENSDFNGTWVNNFENAYIHFTSYGYKEGRKSSPDCDINEYKKMNSNLQNADNLEAYKAYASDTSSTKSYTVKFVDLNGKQIGEDQKVYQGKSADAPSISEIEGYTFKRWDKAFDNVKSDLIVNAVYTKKNIQNAATTTPGTNTPASSALGTETPSNPADLSKEYVYKPIDAGQAANSGNSGSTENKKTDAGSYEPNNSNTTSHAGSSGSNSTSDSTSEKSTNNSVSGNTYDSSNILILLPLMMFGALMYVSRKKNVQ